MKVGWENRKPFSTKSICHLESTLAFNGCSAGTQKQHLQRPKRFLVKKITSEIHPGKIFLVKKQNATVLSGKSILKHMVII